MKEPFSGDPQPPPPDRGTDTYAGSPLTEPDTELALPSAFPPSRRRGASLPTPAGGVPAGDMIGRTVGPYRIREVLGSGGMGFVYKAEDTRLERTVALKFLPPELTRDPTAKGRFLQEARAASALDHPNLCTVFDIGETGDGQLYLAMPAYDGETLRQKIERGPLPIADAVAFAVQIAQGLAKAHRQGIVHRDIKPANVIVTADGIVKIVDFGLAKLAGAAGLTRAGFCVGTPSYMSPEQATGEVDHRTDLWSLGVVLYEMVTGVLPFPGADDMAVIQALLHHEPEPLTRLRPDAPAELERIVAGLLRKDLGNRYPTAENLLGELRALTADSAPPPAPARRAPPSRFRTWTLAATAAAVLVAAAGGAWLWRDRAAAPPPVPGPFLQLTYQEGRESFPSLSPDGEVVVYTRTVQGNADIYWQRVGGENPRNLTADSPAADSQPAFSPDGQRIVFRSERSGGGLFIMGATGESVRRLTGFGYNPAWSPDGREIVFATEEVTEPRVRKARSELWIVDAGTARRRRLATGDAVQPSWSPGGGRIAYWGLEKGSGERGIWTLPARGGDAVRVTGDKHLSWFPLWSPEGKHLYFLSDRSGSMNLWRVAVDGRTGKVLGEPENVTPSSASMAGISLSRDGRRVVFVSSGSSANLERIPFDPAGLAPAGTWSSVTRGSRGIRFGEVSPDGRWLVYSTATPREDLFVLSVGGGDERRLTDDGFKDRVPRWSPDGSRLLFYSDRGGKYEAWTIRPDGSGLEPLTRIAGEPFFNPIWSPDGRQLIGLLGFNRLAMIDLRQPLEKRVPRPLAVSGRGIPSFSGSFSPTDWSPDGRFLAGMDDRPAILLYALDSGRLEELVGRGQGPVWLHDGRTLLYLDAGAIFAVDSRTRETRQVAAPPPGAAFLSVSPGPGDREIFAVLSTESADLWMMEMSGPGSVPG